MSSAAAVVTPLHLFGQFHRVDHVHHFAGASGDFDHSNVVKRTSSDILTSQKQVNHLKAAAGFALPPNDPLFALVFARIPLPCISYNVLRLRRDNAHAWRCAPRWRRSTRKPSSE